MSKNKPLPPLSNPKPIPLADKEGKATIPQRIYVDVKPTYDHCCFFCQAVQERFDEMAKGMADVNWELIAVLPHRKYVTTGGGNGYSDGWMTFWKRIRMSKDDK